MAPRAKTIEDELKKTVAEFWNSRDRDELTVNNVRKHVSGKLGLEEGYLGSGEWKGKSKQIILAAVVRTLPFAACNVYG
jgi:hypothetical protein